MNGAYSNPSLYLFTICLPTGGCQPTTVNDDCSWWDDMAFPANSDHIPLLNRDQGSSISYHEDTFIPSCSP